MKQKLKILKREGLLQDKEDRNRVEALIQRTQATLNADLAKSTHSAYASDWGDFQRFGSSLSQACLPANTETVVLYIQYMADKSLKLNTIRRRLSAIRYYHFEADYDSPTESALAKKMLNAISRQIGYQLEQKQALDVSSLKQMIDLMDSKKLSHLRDRAMLLLGFAGGFRRSEVVSLRIENMHFSGIHLRVHLPRSKTDQMGKGLDKPIFGEENSAYCPVSAIQEWLQASMINTGYVFRRIRRGQAINLSEDKPLSAIAYTNCIKQYAKAIGLDSKCISGHSLRSGFVTSAALRGKDALQIADVTKQDIRTVQRYMRKTKIFEQHAGEGLLASKTK
jgi:site-specific recombinase XerD